MARIDEQLVDLFQTSPVDLDRMRELLTRGANPNHAITENMPVLLMPIYLDQREVYDLLVEHGATQTGYVIELAIRENRPWVMERVDFDDDLTFRLNTYGENWLEQLERVTKEEDTTLLRAALDTQGIRARIESRIAKEEAEYTQIISEAYDVEAIRSAIQSGRTAGLPEHQIPYLNAHSLTAAMAVDDLKLAGLLLDSGVRPNDISFVSDYAAVHQVKSSEAVELLSTHGAEWSQENPALPTMEYTPMEVALDNDRVAAADGILKQLPTALGSPSNMEHRIESPQMLDVLVRHGVIEEERAAELSGKTLEMEFERLLAGAGVDARELIMATNALTMDFDPVPAAELTNDFARVHPLPELDSPREDITLLVVERSYYDSKEGEEEDKSHQEDTTRVARGVASRLGAEDVETHIIPLRHKLTSAMIGGLDLPDKFMDEPMRALLRSDQVREGRVVFSQSMGEIGHENAETAARMFQAHTPVRYAERELDFWDQEINPVIFMSVGNNHKRGDLSQDSSMDTHTSRAMEVGAAEWRVEYWAIPEYSDISGGDILGPIVSENGTLYSGTSFSAPFTASGYREMAARHGFSSGLEYDEMVFAMMASTDKNVKSDSPHAPIDWVEFNVNGAGIAYHPRAFSGVYNPHRADALALEMREVKRDLGLTDGVVRQQVDLDIRDASVNTAEGGQTSEYVYRVTVPTDMTISRLSLYLPQEQNNKTPITLESPSGYSFVLPVSKEGMVSTRALFAEDVTSGQELIIRTSSPLVNHKSGNDANTPDEAPFVVFRGLEPNNAIAAMRETMLQDGRLLTPLSRVSGKDFQVLGGTNITFEQEIFGDAPTGHGLPQTGQPLAHRIP